MSNTPCDWGVGVPLGADQKLRLRVLIGSDGDTLSEPFCSRRAKEMKMEQTKPNVALPMDAAPRLISVTEAARIAGQPRSTFYRLLKSGAAPGALVALPGHRLLIRREALLRWLAGDGVGREVA